MKYDEKLDYDQPIATVLKMYTDRSYFERKYQDSGAWDVEVLEHEKNGNKFRIKCRFTMKSEVPLPDFAKKFIGESVTVVQQDAWDLDKQTGRIDMDIKGAPLKVFTEMQLKEDGQGCANHLRWNVNCSIPLIGGKLEKVLSEDLQQKSRTDYQVSTKILRDYRATTEPT